MKRQTILLLVVMVAALVLSSGVALAVTKQCKPDRRCEGTRKDDTLLGSGGPDRIFGLRGNDDLFGFGDSDKLFGGRGDDDLDGGPGDQADDTLDGDEGFDRYFFAGNWGADTIIDILSTSNRVVVDSESTSDLIVNLNSDSGPVPEVTDGTNTVNWDGNVIDRVTADSPGNATITGNSAFNRIERKGGSSTISGGEGDDEILGGPATDAISGEKGNDDLHSRGGTDTISGGEGDDEIFGGSGNTTISGGEGDDEVSGGSGSENISGEGGNDDIFAGNPEFFEGDPDVGVDTVSGGEGDDEIDVADGFGGDTVDCGENVDGSEDNDVVTRDPANPETGDPGDIISPNCETQNDPPPLFPPCEPGGFCAATSEGDRRTQGGR